MTINKTIVGFYTLYGVNDWYNIFKEQLHILVRSKLYANMEELFVFAYFPQKGEKKLRQLIDAYDIDDKITIMVYNENYWEYPALNALKYYCIDHNCYAVYFHSKGVTSERDVINNPFAVKTWRDSLNYYILEQWQEHIDYLSKETNLSGIHYIEHPQRPGTYTFNGNFWWGNSDYLKNLNTPINSQIDDTDFLSHRTYAELWVTQLPHSWHNAYAKIDDPYKVIDNTYKETPNVQN